MPDNEVNIGTMIQHIVDGNNTEAESTFNDIMLNKTNDALDVKKHEVASNFFGGKADTEFAPSGEGEGK